MEWLPKEKSKRYLYIFIYTVFTAIAVYFLLKYGVGIMLPFLFSYLLSLIISPVIQYINKKTNIPIKILSVIFVVLIISIIVFGLIYIFEKTINEANGILKYLTENYDLTIQQITDWIKSKFGSNKLFSKYIIKDNFIKLSEKMGMNILENISKNIPEIIGKTITGLPNIIFVSIVTVMASYYFCVEVSKESNTKDKKIRKYFNEISEKTKDVILSFIKGYFLMFILTFTQLFIGFNILEIEYSFTISLIISLLDILPVIGIGTIMIPWGIIHIILGNIYIGSGILIVFGIASIIRQIVEPKIIGNSIGLHPLLTLMSMYIGLKLFGVLGLLCCPVLTILSKNIIEYYKEKRGC